MLMYDRVINYFNNKDLSKEQIPADFAKEGVALMLDTLKGADVLIIDKEIEVGASVNELPNLKIPFNNFFIEMHIKDLSYGVHVVVNGRKLDLVAYMHVDGEGMIPIMFVIDLDKFPRMYIGCPTRCKRFNSTKPGLLGTLQCMRTPNNASQCSVGAAVLASVQILVHVVKYINKKPEYEVVDVPPTPPRNSKNKGKSYPKSSNRYIYINKSPTLYVEQNKTKSKGSKKSPHERRGHYRYYKNGKVVWVKPSKVHGGKKEQKIYRI